MDIQQAITKLATSDPTIQATAAEWCAQNADAAGPAAVLLVNHLASPDEAVREWCTSALESLGPPPDEQLAPLADLADSASDDIAYWSITLLGRAGSAAALHAAKLKAVATGGRSDVIRKRAEWAVGKVAR